MSNSKEAIINYALEYLKMQIEAMCFKEYTDISGKQCL